MIAPAVIPEGQTEFVFRRWDTAAELCRYVAATQREALERAVREGRSLYRASLYRASLVGARLDGASLVGARLVGARLVGARLDGARLDGASLDGASLVGARLVGASLDRASLVGARLDGARLDGARLVGASLVGASLVGASLVGIRDDFFAVLDLAPNEVDGLEAALRAGRVDGSQYTGECACLVGTIANVRGRYYLDLGELTPSASRPSEVWFLAIRRGRCAGDPIVDVTLGWIAEWRTRHAAKIVAAKPKPKAKVAPKAKPKRAATRKPATKRAKAARSK